MIVDNNTGTTYSYQDLFIKMNSDDFYFKSWKYDSFFGFIVNFLKAIINGKDITLLDKEFTENELQNLGCQNGYKDQKIKLSGPTTIEDTSQFINLIKSSESNISIFTSGTTGIPKKVIHTIPSLTRMTRVGKEYSQDVWGMAYNPTHMAGLQVLFQAILNMNNIIYLFDRSLKGILTDLNEYQITHLSATPTFYRMLLSEGKKLHSVKRVTLGGEKSDQRLIANLKTTFPNAKINNIYASTELGSLFVADGEVFKVPKEIQDKVKVIENELVISKDLAPDKSVSESKWYKTGDIVDVVSEKPLSFKFLNRKSEKINVGGYMVSPVEVEDCIRKIESVFDVRVFGRENSVLGNILCAEIVMKKGASTTAKEVKKILKEDLQDFKIPATIKFTDQIMKTRTGKVKR